MTAKLAHFGVHWVLTGPLALAAYARASGNDASVVWPVVVPDAHEDNLERLAEAMFDMSAVPVGVVALPMFSWRLTFRD